MSNDDFNLTYYNHKGLNDDLFNKNETATPKPSKARRQIHHSKTVEECLVEETDDINSSLKSLDKTAILRDNKSTEKIAKPISSPSNQLPQPQQLSHAPAIDFKLDVKIEINSGKCILHASKSNQKGKMNLLLYFLKGQHFLLFLFL